MGLPQEKPLVDFGCKKVGAEEFYQALFFYTESYRKYGSKMMVPVTFSNLDGGTWRSVALGEIHDLCSHRNDAYVSPCTYFPRKVRGEWVASNGKSRVQQLCGFVLDLDMVAPSRLNSALWGFWQMGVPVPTYIVCSGHGTHLYYVLTVPVDLLKRWNKELEAINSYLYSLYEPSEEWALFDFSQDTVESWQLGKVDRHGITQPYRVVGSLAKNGKDTVSAWRVGEEWEIGDLARLAGLGQTVFTKDGFDMKRSMLSAQFAEQREKPYVKKTSKRGWNPGFYRWLAAKVYDHARLYGEVGHRYKQVQALTVAAIKDRVPRDQLEADVRRICERWNQCAQEFHHDPVGWDECQKAMACFVDCYSHRRFPKWWLEKLCGWDFGTQKRNGRTQAEHLELARTMKAFYVNAGIKKAAGGGGAGRPVGSGTKELQIKAYAAEHPEANHSEIARALGVSRTTVIKWLKKGRSDVQSQ